MSPRTRKSSPADPPASSGASRRARAPSKNALELRVRELEERIVVLEQDVRVLTESRQLAVQPAQQPPRPPQELEGELLQAIRSLDREGRLDGLVPIPSLRRRFPSSQRLQLDRALLELERRFDIDLKIANDPVAVEAPGDGIAHPSRGLLYYAVVR